MAAVKAAATRIYGVPNIPNEVWCLVIKKGNKAQKLHMDCLAKGTVGVFFMLTKGYQTQYVPPEGTPEQMIPTKWEVKKCKLNTLAAGNMYALNLDWPHRGPIHYLKADRMVIFMSYGNQPTDTPPVHHPEFIMARSAE